MPVLLRYRLVGGVRFYERKEVRDVLAYLRLLANEKDEVSLRRVLNVPKRGIGDRAEEYVAAYAAREKISFAEALSSPKDVPGLATRSATAIKGFNDLIDGLRDQARSAGPIAELVEAGWIERLDAGLALGARDHEAGLAEDIQVLGDRRCVHVELVDKLAGSPLALSEQLDDASAGGIGDGGEAFHAAND